MDLNQPGKSNASTKINNGDYDENSSWSFSSEDGNKLLGPAGDDWTNYGKWHLGKNTAENPKTKAYYGYPFGKDSKVYRSGLIAIRQRSSGQGATDIYNAAGDLIDMIDKKTGKSADNQVVKFPNSPPSPAGYQVKAAKSGDSAEIYIYDIIGSGWLGGISAENFASDLKALGNVRTIDVRINSDGGDVFDGRTIYSLLAQHKANINIYVDGLAASIASLIAMAGNRIIMADGSMMMIHNAWGLVVGNADEMRKQANLWEMIDQTLVKTYCARTGISAPKCIEMMNEETWMTADEALKNGFADEIVEGKKVAAQVRDLVSSKDGRVVPISDRFHNVPTNLRPRRIAAMGENERLRKLIQN